MKKKKNKPKAKPAAGMRIEYVAPGALNPAPYNPRKITDDALGRLAKLLDAHGFVDPIVARREDGLVIGGHQRLRANELRIKPDAKVPVIFLDGLTDVRAKTLNISLNNPAAQGEYDPAKLADLLQELNTGEYDWESLTAFSQAEMAELLDGADESGDSKKTEPVITELYQVVVLCEDENQQKKLYERMIGEGFKCRLLIL